MQSTTVNIRELQARFEELVTLAESGVDVIVTDDGSHRAKLVPCPGGKRVAGLHPGFFRPADDLRRAASRHILAGGAMIGLLDTHTFLWWDSDPGRLSLPARRFIEDPANQILLSVVSIWEIVIKEQLGKLPLAGSLDEVVRRQQQNGLVLLRLSTRTLSIVS